MCNLLNRAPMQVEVLLAEVDLRNGLVIFGPGTLMAVSTFS